jgi:hypothetical protein
MRTNGYNTNVPSDGRRTWIARKFDSSAEADAHDLEYWLQIPQADRAVRVWKLSEELYRLAGRFPDEPRLRRSVERVHRR